MPDPIAIVPVKTTSTAKRRLAHVADSRSREALVARLFTHVTGVLREADLEVIAVCSGPAPDPDIETWAEEGGGLNRALRSVLRRTGGSALVVPADLPWLTVADVRRLLAEEGDVVVARARDGGTNGLLLRRRVPPSFGPRSAVAHAAAARARGLRARVVEIPGFEDDLDDEAALVRARALSPALRGFQDMRDAGAWSGPGVLGS